MEADRRVNPDYRYEECCKKVAIHSEKILALEIRLDNNLKDVDDHDTEIKIMRSAVEELKHIAHTLKDFMTSQNSMNASTSGEIKKLMEFQIKIMTLGSVAVPILGFVGAFIFNWFFGGK